MLKYMKIVVAICLFLFLTTRAEGALREWKQLTVGDGLLTNHIHSSDMDDEGLMWFATRYGLSSYDGTSVRTYLPLSAHTDPKIYNDVLSVAPVSGDKVFFITTLAFGVYDKSQNSFRVIPIKEIELFKVLYKLASGELMISGSGIVVIFDPETGKYHSVQSGNEDVRLDVESIFQDRIGQIWMGTPNAGLVRYSPHEQRVYTYPSTSRLERIRSIAQDSQDRIYLGTQSSGLYLLHDPYSPSNSKISKIGGKILDSSFPICSILEVSDRKELWIATNGGICAFDMVDMKFKGKVDGLEASQVIYLWCDEGIIWAATSDSGVYYIDTVPPVFNPSVTPLPADFGSPVFAFEDNRGTLWTGSLAYPLVCNSENATKWNQYFGELGYPRGDMPVIFSIAEDSEGNMYFGGYAAGIIKQDIKSGKVEYFSDGNCQAVPDNRVMRLKSDSKGNLWVGTMKGFGVFLKDGRQIKLSDSGDVMGIGEKNNRMYVATLNDGIFYVDLDGLMSGNYEMMNSRVTMSDGFQPVILSLTQSDCRDQLYVGTEDEGVWIYDISTGEYRLSDFVSRHNNLQIAFMNEDRYGYLWIATNQGLYKINVRNQEERALYTVADGLDRDYFCYNGMANDSILYLPTNKGLEIIDIDATRRQMDNHEPVKFGFVGMLFNNLRFEDLPEESRRTISGDLLPYYSDRIIIPNSLNNFTISFAPFDYRNPGQVSFSYCLEGYESDWQQAPEERLSATYTNLPSGNYTFRLRADSGDGKWNGVEKVLNIRILPPWYLSWWAYMIYAILVMMAVVGVVWGIRRRERMRARMELMKREKENLEEINRTKLRFFTNVTHELLTPLTVISAAIGELRKKGSDIGALCRIADVNVSKLVRLLQQILEFRKVETDNIRLRVNYGDIKTFVANSIEALRPLTLRKFMTLELNLPKDRIMGYFDPDKLDKILYNLISNAAKYSDENGMISVSVTCVDGNKAIMIKVSDTGAGIPADKLDNLFTRFYDGDYREHNTSGTGIGLSLTRDLVVLNHGKIDVESKVGEGTTFLVVLPIDAEAFDKNEMGSSEAWKVDWINAGSSADENDTAEGFSFCKEEEVPVPSRDSKKPKVLLIEDNEDLTDLMRRQLSDDYEVMVAADAGSGLEMAFDGAPDIIVTDLSLPDMDGLELIRSLRNDTRTASLPIIVLTARRQNEDRADCYMAGADVYLAKPFDYGLLKACLSTQLKSRSQKSVDMTDSLVINLKKIDYRSPDLQFLKLATEVVERNLDKTEFDIPMFAKEVGVSKTHLFRKLKELTDMSPSHFIRITRLRAACNILRQHPDIRVGELAYMVGFSDSRYFGKCFKNEFGVTPGEYKSGKNDS